MCTYFQVKVSIYMLLCYILIIILEDNKYLKPNFKQKQCKGSYKLNSLVVISVLLDEACCKSRVEGSF